MIIRTDVGDFPAPPHIVKAHAAAKLRRDGRVDGRTKAGKLFYLLERGFMDAKVARWLTDGALAELNAELTHSNKGTKHMAKGSLPSKQIGADKTASSPKIRIERASIDTQKPESHYAKILEKAINNAPTQSKGKNGN